MPIKTILLYLAGNRKAIDRMARDKSAIWYGLFFVVISGVAREYDQESLLHQPLFFLAPLLLSVPLALLFYGYLKLKHLPWRTSGGIRSFFGLFWMTAPLAWLYALPVEYLFSSLTALKLNAILLALVALWRVVLFARVVAQTLQQRFWQILCEILWGGSLIAFVAMFYYSLSLTEIMGGTVHSTESALKAGIAGWTVSTTGILAVVLLPVHFFRGKPRITFPAQDARSPFLLMLPAVLMILSAMLLAVRQPALFRSQKALNLLNSPPTAREGLDYLSEFEPGDFAHTWPLPPASRAGPMRLYMAKNMQDELDPEHAAWIEERIVDYLDEYLDSVSGVFYSSNQVMEMLIALPPSSRITALLVKHRQKITEQIVAQFSYSDPGRAGQLRKMQQRLSMEDDPSFEPLITRIEQHLESGGQAPPPSATP